jgi:glycosyltransferase involved in cell wall biosynthesis
MKNKAKLIFDIFDLWPETYPLSKNVMLKFPFFIWKRMRDQYLKVADLVSVECELFENVLGLVNKGIPTKTIYPALDEVSMSVRPKWDNNIVQLAYLGSINNIIDIDTILYLVREIVCFKPVIVHVIGQGERKVEFIGGLQESGAVVEDYGVVFDLAKKKVIFDMCHLGLNIMLPNVCVGLSMKSVEYFRFGLPIINNIPFDTSAMVSTYGAGFNLEPDSITSIARQIAFMKEEEGMAMRKGAISIFIDNMSPSAITKKLEEVIDNCG